MSNLIEAARARILREMQAVLASLPEEELDSVIGVLRPVDGGRFVPRPDEREPKRDSVWIVGQRMAPKGFPLDVTATEAVALVEENLEEMAEELASTISFWAGQLIEDALRPSVLARTSLLVDRWSLPDGLGRGGDSSLPVDSGWLALKFLMGASESENTAWQEGAPVMAKWPPEAKPLDVAKWLQPKLNQPPWGAKGRGDDLLRRVEEGRGFYGFIETEGGREIRLTPGDFALLYLAERSVVEAQRRPAIAVPAGKVHHQFLTGMGRLRDVKRTGGALDRIDEGGEERLILIPREGQAIQLGMEWEPQSSLHERLMRGVRAVCGVKGLKHWAALLKMGAVEGERQGVVRYSSDDHLKALGVPPSSVQGRAKAREEATLVVEMFMRMKLAVATYERKGRKRGMVKKWKEWPLLIQAERSYVAAGKAGATLEGAIFQFHPVIYRDVRREDGLGRNWFPVPADLPQVNVGTYPYAIQLGLVLACRWRWEWGNERDHLAISGANLLEMGSIPFRTRDPAGTWDTLHRNLEELRRREALGAWRWDNGRPGRQEICRIYPAAWQADRTIRGLPAVEVKLGESVMTGAELRAWRQARGLKQAEAAAALDVSQATISRAEKRGVSLLPARIRERVRLIR